MKWLAKAFCRARIYILAVPFAIWLTGVASNQLVLVANGGKFPVQMNKMFLKPFQEDMVDDMIDKIHCVMTNKTHLNFLADYINLHTEILSPGDVLIGVGEDLFEVANIVWLTVMVMTLANSPDPVKVNV